MVWICCQRLVKRLTRADEVCSSAGNEAQNVERISVIWGYAQCLRNVRRSFLRLVPFESQNGQRDPWVGVSHKFLGGTPEMRRRGIAVA